MSEPRASEPRDRARDELARRLYDTAHLTGTFTLRSGATSLGEVVFLPRAEQPRTLAERERQAIVDTLQRTSGRLAETARRLGISRTTLWRRLKAYGLRPSNGRPRPASRA